MNHEKKVEQVHLLFHRLVQVMLGYLVDIFDEQNLTLAQISLLSVLAVSGPASIGEIAGYLHTGQSAASLLVDKLVQTDLAERTDDPADRRRAIVRLSPRWGELTKRLIDGRGKNLVWLRGLDDIKLTAMIDALTAVTESLGKDNILKEVSHDKSHAE